METQRWKGLGAVPEERAVVMHSDEGEGALPSSLGPIKEAQAPSPAQVGVMIAAEESLPEAELGRKEGALKGGATSADMLDRLYRLQADLQKHELLQEQDHQHPKQSAHALKQTLALLQDDVRFVLSSMAQYLKDGLLQIIALNLLYKMLLHEASLVEVMLHLGVLPLLGKLVEVQQSNELIRDAVKKLLSLLVVGGEAQPDEHKRDGRRARLGLEDDDKPIDHKYLPYRVSRINNSYMRNILGHTPACNNRANREEHGRPDTIPSLPAPISDDDNAVDNGEEVQETTSPPPHSSSINNVQEEHEPLGLSTSLSPLRRRRRASSSKRGSKPSPCRKRTGAAAGRKGNAQPKKPRQQQQDGSDDNSSNGSNTRAARFPHDDPVEVSHHPVVHKIFNNKVHRPFLPLHDMMHLFQVLDEHNTGLLPAPRFEKALTCLGLSLDSQEISNMLKDFGVREGDLIDYELFCTSGKIICVKLIGAPTSLPLKPWIKRSKHFEPDKAIPGAATWAGHKKWFRHRRAKAATWLIRKGLRAVQMIRVRQATHEVLLLYARKAFAVTYLLSRVRSARDHVEDQTACVKWLQYRTIQARKAKAKHAEAFRFLLKRGQLALEMQPRPQYKVNTVNYQTLYRVRWLHDLAFTFLKAQGVAALAKANRAIVHRRRQKEEFNELRNFGKRALAKQDIIIEQKYKREATQDILSNVARRQMDVWEKRELTLQWLLNRAARAMEHVADVFDAASYLRARAEKAVQTWAGREMALTFLLSQRQHAFTTQTRKIHAILYLLERARVTFALLLAKEAATAYLLERVEVARRCRVNHKEAHAFLKAKAQACIDRENARAAARRFLLKKARFAMEHTKNKAKAVFELKRIVDDVRAEMYRYTMGVLYKDVIAKVKNDLRAEERERANKWGQLTADEVFDAKLKEAFQLYDLNNAGEIDRLDFRYLVENLNLVAKMNKDEFDQFFDMVDRDGSGKIEFEEFASWMRFEMSRTGTAAVVANNTTAAGGSSVNTKRQQQLSKPSLLPVEERALLTTIAMVKKGEIPEREQGGAMAPVDVNKVLSGLAARPTRNNGTPDNLGRSTKDVTPPRKTVRKGDTPEAAGAGASPPHQQQSPPPPYAELAAKGAEVKSWLMGKVYGATAQKKT